MLAIVYEMKVSADKERIFRDAWHTVTAEMVANHGSLGARLHLSETGTWIAYAQWPDHESWMNGHKLIDERIRQLHLDEYFLEVPTVLLKLTVVDDLLELPQRQKR